MIGALLGYSLGNLKTRALRSLLTIVSVMIGIAAITSLISFGNGISSYVDEMAQKMGNDKIIIQPRGFGFGPPPVDTNVVLDADDVDVIEDVHGVEEATGVYILSGEVEFDSKKKYVFMFGSDFQNHPELIKEVYALTLLEGNELRGREKNKALLGYNYQLAYKIFEKPMRLRDKIVINDHPFEVAGFYDEVGNPQDDSNVYITNEAAEEVFDAKNYHFILARSSPGSSPTDVSESIARSLRRHRNQERGQEDFFVQTFEQVIATFTSILGVITGVVVLIGLISVVVAAVNIMNTMYAAILERTKEIGVMKAIGSRNKHILFLFMVESGILSLVGGVLGVGLGYAVSSFAGQQVSLAGYSIFSPLFSWSLVVGALIFSFFIGILSGFLPAYRASKLAPIEALRYE